MISEIIANKKGGAKCNEEVYVVPSNLRCTAVEEQSNTFDKGEFDQTLIAAERGTNRCMQYH